MTDDRRSQLANPLGAAAVIVLQAAAAMTLLTATSTADESPAADTGLIGYWKLRGDCRDSSGNGNDGINHGVDLTEGKFSGRGSDEPEHGARDGFHKT